MNVVMTEHGGLIEVQGTAEGATFSRDELSELLALASGASGDYRLPRAALGEVKASGRSITTGAWWEKLFRHRYEPADLADQ